MKWNALVSIILSILLIWGAPASIRHTTATGLAREPCDPICDRAKAKARNACGTSHAKITDCECTGDPILTAETTFECLVW
jgi:hypothetical protein